LAKPGTKTNPAWLRSVAPIQQLSLVDPFPTPGRLADVSLSHLVPIASGTCLPCCGLDRGSRCPPHANPLSQNLLSEQADLIQASSSLWPQLADGALDQNLGTWMANFRAELDHFSWRDFRACKPLSPNRRSPMASHLRRPRANRSAFWGTSAFARPHAS